MFRNADTIAAIATPLGTGGIGIVRVSGPEAAALASKIFRPLRPPAHWVSHRLYLGHLIDPAGGEALDEVLLTVMRAPRSYTCEDVVEIHAHSGPILLRRILEIVLANGARLAEAGEFTLRAFLNGRIDLTQAEAVMDLINARSERGLMLGMRQLDGALRDAIEALKAKCVALLAQIEVQIDYPEEDRDALPAAGLAAELRADAIVPVQRALEGLRERQIWVEGLATVITGRVNVGKSSLLNRLLNEERAIVTPFPGTTRDVIEATLLIGGVPLRLMDTAGIRGAARGIETAGIRRAEAKVAEADLVLLVLDRSRPFRRDDQDLMERLRTRRAIAVLNKADLPNRLPADARSRLEADFPTVEVSALTGAGFDQLRHAICTLVAAEQNAHGDTVMAPNVRQAQALADTLGCLQRAAAGLERQGPLDLVAVDLRGALDSLGAIVGETTPDDILDEIFSRFCVGK